MTPQEIANIVSMLGFPIIIVLAVMWFISRQLWPFIVSYMSGYVTVLERNASVIEKMGNAIDAVGTQIHSQPNMQLSATLITLIERMDQQHQNMGQQLDGSKREIMQAINSNTNLTSRVYTEIIKPPDETK